MFFLVHFNCLIINCTTNKLSSLSNKMKRFFLISTSWYQPTNPRLTQMCLQETLNNTTPPIRMNTLHPRCRHTRKSTQVISQHIKRNQIGYFKIKRLQMNCRLFWKGRRLRPQYETIIFGEN